jgi:lysozyme
MPAAHGRAVRVRILRRFCLALACGLLAAASTPTGWRLGDANSAGAAAVEAAAVRSGLAPLLRIEPTERAASTLSPLAIALPPGSRPDLDHIAVKPWLTRLQAPERAFDGSYLPRRYAASVLTTSEAGIAHIKRSEGLRLKAYTGVSGIVLIGYGHHNEWQTLDRRITRAEAEAILRDDLDRFEAAIGRHVEVPLTQGEFDALVDFAYTVGVGNFLRSSVYRRLNRGDRQGAADALLLWNKVRRGDELVEFTHLTNRRRQARAMFLGETKMAQLN